MDSFFHKIYNDISYKMIIPYENIIIEQRNYSYILQNIGTYHELENKNIFHKYYLYHAHDNKIIIIIRHGAKYYWSNITINLILE